MIGPESVPLLVAVALAALFFFGVLTDLSRARVERRRSRRRRPQLTEFPKECYEGRACPLRRGRVLKPWAPERITTPEAPLGRRQTTPHGDGRSFLQTKPEAAGGVLAPELPRPSRPPADSKVPHHPTPAFAQRGPLSRTVADSHVGGAPPNGEKYRKIVVHYSDNKIVKGYSFDFYPNKPGFHLIPTIGDFALADESIEVRMNELKAVFFVRDFAGNPEYDEEKQFADGKRPPGRKVAVTFTDGERLVGSTMGYDLSRPGFFFFPADDKANNLAVFAVSAAVKEVSLL